MSADKGFINVLKPPYLSSSDVVIKVRGMLRRVTGDKAIKVGHLGTLDEGGVGVLPIAVGKATRLFDYMLSQPKQYRAGFVFGVTTDTLDSYGTVIETDIGVNVSRDSLQNAISELIGKQSQMPPQYSAKNVNGRRAYDLARQGAQFTLAPKEIEIFNISIVEQTAKNAYTLDIKCSSGTYVRCIARDLAAKLNTVGLMSYIIRTDCHCFSIEDSVTLQQIEQMPLQFITPIDTVFSNYPRVAFSSESQAAFKLKNGVTVPATTSLRGDYLTYIDDCLFGICENDLDGNIRVKVRLYDY